MTKNQEYIERYKEIAMEQMRRYGIPASVILAQGILESANGQSQLARNENNHFGIKATPSWLAAGGAYGVYADDKPNEKFCKYASVADSYEHHSQFLKNNQRYADCFRLSADDYRGWCIGLDKAGYATSGTYGKNLINTIERLGLQDIDRQVMQQMQAEGRTIGQQTAYTQSPSPISQAQGTGYSMPVKRDEFMLITSPFGMRMHPIDHVSKMHHGIDIKTNHDIILATEQGGKVIEAGYDSKGGGNYVKVAYERTDGTKTNVTFCHLSEIRVKVGDIVNAGQPIGVSGTTGKSTGDHLHLSVRQDNADGQSRYIDPAAYLAEIAQKGRLTQQALYNGQDLLAKYRSKDPSEGQFASTNAVLSADDWMKKLLSSEDSGLDIGMNMGDPIVELVMEAFTALMAFAIQIDGQSEEEKKQMVTDTVVSKRFDLSSYLPNRQECVISVEDNGRAVLKSNGQTVPLSYTNLAALSSLLHTSLPDELKMKRIAAWADNIILSAKASQNYEQVLSKQQEQAAVIQR